MELKLVTRPSQDATTSSEDVQFPGETWCVKTYMYKEIDGGYSLWEQELARVKPDILYLYSVRQENMMIDGFLQTVYIIRADLRKMKRVFKIDVGRIPEDEIDDYVKNVMKKFKEMPEGELPDFRFPDSDIDLASDFDKRNEE